MRGIADAMTAAMRHASLEPDNVRFATGTVWVVDTCVTVRWGWICFPATLLALQLMFFLMVLAQWQRSVCRHDWKASALALLFHPVEPPREGLESRRAMYEASKAVKVRLVRERDGWRFSQEH